MPTTIDCPSCGSPVAAGRLSCPSCGAIVAAVRAVSRPRSGESFPEPVGSSPGPDGDAVAAAARRSDAPQTAQEQVAEARDAGEATASPRAPADPFQGARSVPGAYLPPSAIFPAPTASAVPPSPGSSGSESAAPGPATASPRPGSTVREGPASALTLRALGEPAASWLLVLGSVLGVVGFLLPWSPNGVIGSSGDAGYLGRWGLANAAYLLVMAASFGCLALQVLETRLPATVRDGICPLVLGGFLLGLGWTYVAGPFGADLGVQAILVAGIVLVLGGILGLRAVASRGGGPPAS
jgi:uncharacterized Zn finger protein (UPF0148 family)